MKKLIALFFIVPLMSMINLNDNSRFIGKWIGDDENQIGYLTFDSEGYAYFEVQGQVLGGKEFVQNGKKGRMTYEIDSEKSPIQLDIIVTILETNEQHKLLCIANFIDNDTMEFAINFEGARPTEFNLENAIILKRDK